MFSSPRTRTLMRAAVLPMAALAMAVTASAVRADDLVVTHAQGETTVPANPQTVVVFTLGALDTLDAIGVPVAGVTKGLKPDYLSKYAGDDYRKIGSLFEPDYEAIVVLDPDLIIIGGRSAAKYAELAKIAPTIDVTPSREDYLASAASHARTLGRIFDKEAEVQSLLDELDASTEKLRSLAGEAGTALAVITTGGKMSAHGPGSRFAVLYDGYGFTPAAEGLSTGTHGQPISFEYLLETDPDWLFVVDRDAAIGREGQSAQQFFDNEIMHKTKAWSQDQVVYVNPQYWYLVVGGPRALKSNVDQIIAALETK